MGTVKTYNKGDYEELEADDLTTITALATTCLKRHGGKPCKYPATDEGLERFMQRSQEFFEYCNEINKELEASKRLIPDVEAWCLYLGIVRSTLHEYSKRSQEWHDAVEMVKTGILTAKKQLAFKGRLPQVVAIFDLVNNHNYRNASEFHLVAETQTNEQTPRIDASQLDRIASTVDADTAEALALPPPQMPYE